MIRNMDFNGRILLPAKYRRTLSLRPNDLVELRLNGQELILVPYNKKCRICGSAEGLIDCKNFCICKKCRAKIP